MLKEQSIERQKENSAKTKSEAKKITSLSKDKRNIKYIPANQPSTPNSLEIKNKDRQSLVSQSFDNFQIDQRFYQNQRPQGYPMNPGYGYCYNQNYHQQQMHYSQNFQTENRSGCYPNLNMTQDQYVNSANNFYPEMGMGSWCGPMNQPADTYNQQYPQFQRQNRQGANFGMVKQPEKLKSGVKSGQTTWNLNLNKINSTVLNFRRK